MKFVFVLILVMVSPLMLISQESVEVCGDYTYYAPDNISIVDAKRIAVKRAKVIAIEKKFSSSILQENILIKDESNAAADQDQFYSNIVDNIKGEWISDVGDPVFEIRYEGDNIVIKASVCGMVREIKTAKVDLDIKVLRNGTGAGFESLDFRDENDLYLWFKSPTNGWLAVYLVDEKSKANCILPYMRETSGIQQIEGGKEYVFFSEKDSETPSLVDEYILTCSKDLEHNRLYIVFSQTPFIKANDGVSGKGVPRQLPFKKFLKWLAENRSQDEKMLVQIKTITIRK